MDLQIKTFNELTNAELYEILKSRAEVFMIGQRIMYLDMDDIDFDSFHFFCIENGRVVAYLRAFYENDKSVVRIGRVLTLFQGKGIGKRFMEDCIPEIKSKMNAAKIVMDSQKHAVGFYEKFGFRVTSGDFIEAGVVHVKMEKEL